MALAEEELRSLRDGDLDRSSGVERDLCPRNSLRIGLRCCGVGRALSLGASDTVVCSVVDSVGGEVSSGFVVCHKRSVRSNCLR